MKFYARAIKILDFIGKGKRMFAANLLGVAASFSFIAPPAFAMESEWPKFSAGYEVRFMRDMIDHHHMAVMMTETCQMKASHTELVTMCGAMHDAQKMEITTMQGWLKTWYGIDYEPMMNPDEMKDMEAMENLPQNEFEVEFMKEMIPHHLKAILSSTPCLVRASHGELIDMCVDIVSTQANEVKMLREWLCEWYEVCQPQKAHRRDTQH